MSYTTVKRQCNDVVQRLGVSDMFICGPLFDELFHCKTQCDDVVHRLGVSDMFIYGPLFW